MKVIEIKYEDKNEICQKLEQANSALEEAMFKLKESMSESDTRMWRAEGDYRMGRSRSNYREYYPEEKYYKDDFRYRY